MKIPQTSIDELIIRLSQEFREELKDTLCIFKDSLYGLSEEMDNISSEDIVEAVARIIAKKHE